MTWKLSEPLIVRYFFNLASAHESTRSPTSMSFKKNLGFGLSANVVPRKFLQSMALRTLPPVPTYRLVEHFANRPTWLTFPLLCLVTLNRWMMGHWSCSKYYGYCQNAGVTYIVKNSVAAFDDATFGYVLHCYKHFLEDMYDKCLVVFL